eukprot:s4390_g5.t1
MSVSAEEVAKHNTDKDCWVIVGDQVLDVTNFLSEHPGGKKSIMMFAGKDATEEHSYAFLRKRLIESVAHEEKVMRDLVAVQVKLRDIDYTASWKFRAELAKVPRAWWQDRVGTGDELSDLGMFLEGTAAGCTCALAARRQFRTRSSRQVAKVVCQAIVEMHEATEILSNVDFEVPVGARAVIVGPNGCGKTTLLTTIANRDSVEGGFLDIDASSIGWLRQEAISGSKKTVYAEAASQMPAMAARKALDEAQAALEEAKSKGTKMAEKLTAAYEEAVAKFEAAGGWALKAKVASVLNGLGFTDADAWHCLAFIGSPIDEDHLAEAVDFDKSCSELSGGWQMRVALARALLQEPQLLLLDEPTNHMDAAAKGWLASYLAKGTLLLVTHDRALLDELHCSQVFEISERRVLRYDEWEKDRKIRLANLQKEMEKLQRTIAHDEDYVARFGAKASHAAQALLHM